MRYVVLDAQALNERESAHACLKKQLSLPEWYGGNLDALEDCLGELGAETAILLIHSGRLSGYGSRVRAVFEDAAKEEFAFRFVCLP